MHLPGNPQADEAIKPLYWVAQTATAVILAVVLQGMSIPAALGTTMTGYESHSGLPLADELLVGRVRDEVSGYYMPAPEKNLLYYLLKKVDKGSLNEEQFEYLKQNLSGCRQNPHYHRRKDKNA